MENESLTLTSEIEETTEESPTVILSKPFAFEDNIYREIDLSGLWELTTEDMVAAEKYMSRNGNISVMPEISIEYACFICSRATDLPVEFFRRLPPKDAIKIKNRVTGFFYGEG